jgi:ubiquinone/menaquinone biosynthesis C-methylase UbiE
MLTESPLERSRAGGGEAYRERRIAHWDRVAAAYKDRPHVARSYHRRLERVYGFAVPAGSRVLEIGCGTGDLLAALAQEGGVGVDFSPAMLAEARRRYPNLQFVEADAHDLSALEGTFDIIVLSDLLDDVWDVQELLDELHRLCHPGTRVVINFFSRLWEIPLRIAARLKLARHCSSRTG